MEIKHVKIKDWEVCCNDFLTACINDSIHLDYTEQHFQLKGVWAKISYCPYCEKEIKYPLEKEQ